MDSQKRTVITSSVLTSVVLGLAFIFTTVVHFPNSNSRQLTGTRVDLVTSTSAMSSGRVPSANILPDGYGWVLTTAGLELTSNGGTSFTVAQTPIPTPNIHDVAVNGKHIHIAGVINGSPAIELSHDSGATWNAVALPTGSGHAGVAQFVTNRGILIGLLVTDVSSSNSSSCEWYSTPDGGLTWTLHAMPAAGVVTDVDTDLWLAAGPQFTTLYRSSNQGATWTKVQGPDSTTNNVGALSVLGQLKNGDVVLASTAMNGETSSKFGVTIYLSGDRGITWKFLAHTSFAGQINFGETVTGAIYDDSIWLGSPTDQRVIIISSNGTMTSTRDTGDIFPGGAIYSISPTGSSTAWVTAMNDQCPSGKTSCTEVGALFRTVDSGKSWSKVNLTPKPIS